MPTKPQFIETVNKEHGTLSVHYLNKPGTILYIKILELPELIKFLRKYNDLTQTAKG